MANFDQKQTLQIFPETVISVSGNFLQLAALETRYN